MSPVPVETLQLRAIEQRQQLHQTTVALREKVRRTGEMLQITKQVREHLLAFCVGASLAGAAAGYAVASVFTND